MVYILRFFSSSKCSLFHNSNVFGSCIIYILYTGCAKIKKKFRRQKFKWTKTTTVSHSGVGMGIWSGSDSRRQQLHWDLMAGKIRWKLSMWDASAALIMETKWVSETSDFGISLTDATTTEDLVHIFNRQVSETSDFGLSLTEATTKQDLVHIFNRRVSETSDFGISLTDATTTEDLVHIFNRRVSETSDFGLSLTKATATQDLVRIFNRRVSETSDFGLSEGGYHHRRFSAYI